MLCQKDCSTNFVRPGLFWTELLNQEIFSRLAFQVQQYVAGRAGDHGTLVLQLHFDKATVAKLVSSSKALQGNLPAEAGRLQFCMFQMVPWYFRLLYHTMRLQVDNKVW